MGKLEAGFALSRLNDDFRDMVSGENVEQDGHSIASVSLLSCHSSSVWEGMCFSAASPDEPTAQKKN